MGTPPAPPAPRGANPLVPPPAPQGGDLLGSIKPVLNPALTNAVTPLQPGASPFSRNFAYKPLGGLRVPSGWAMAGLNPLEKGIYTSVSHSTGNYDNPLQMGQAAQRRRGSQVGFQPGY